MSHGKKDKTREPQYQVLLDLKKNKGLTSLGLMTNQVWNDDPKRLLFLLSRYKFVAKMLRGKTSALEIGCGDAFGSRIVLQEVGRLRAVDFDPVFIRDIGERMEDKWHFEYGTHDILEGPVEGSFDAAYCLDLIEHIPKQKERIFMASVAGSVNAHGTVIIGTPSAQSQAYASPASKEGHVNCYDGEDLKRLALEYFHNVFLFSMNDEVVHTGFHPMAHYLLVVCSDKRSS